MAADEVREAAEAAFRARDAILALVMRLGLAALDQAAAGDARCGWIQLDDEVEFDGSTWQLGATWRRQGDEVVLVGAMQSPGVVSAEDMARMLGAQAASFKFVLPAVWLRAAARAQDGGFGLGDGS